MRMEASGKIAQHERRIHIKKGYYRAQLLSVKPRQKQDGTPIEGKYGRQIICMFKPFGEDGQPMTTTETNSEGGSLTKSVEIPMVLNSEYKQLDGTYRTAVTPNSLITKVFKNLGWQFSEDGFDTEDFVGKLCELNIDDYDAKETKQDGQGNDVETMYKASGIKDVNKLDGDEPTVTVEKVGDGAQASPAPIGTNVNSDLKRRMDNLQDLKAKGFMTDKGFEMAMGQLMKEMNR